MTIAATLRHATREKLAPHPPFINMASEHLDWLVERLTLSYYAQGDIVLAPGPSPETFYIIKQGVIIAERDSASPPHKQGWLELREGECLPFAALISGRPVVSTYRAATDTFCFELPLADFHALRAMSPVFQDFCTHRLAHLFGQAKRILQTHYAHSASEQQSLMSPLAHVMHPDPVTCSPDTPLAQVLDTMNHLGIGSMVAIDAARRPLGIFTLRDMLPRVVLPRLDMATPFGEVMTPDPVAMTPQHFAHDAALTMARHGFRHVLVTDQGKLVGLVSERDLFSLQRLGLRQIGDTIRHADTLATLKACAADIRQLAHNMLAQGVGAEQLAQIISTLNDVLTERLLQLELKDSPAAGIEFCWLALGSEGRFEQTLNTDQDNGLIFTPPPGQSDEATRDTLLAFAADINHALAECGFPLCTGGVMASNPKWCLSLTQWQNTFARWIDQGDPNALLHASIFFDFRALFGQHDLAHQLRQFVVDKAAGNPRFLHQMSANALRNKPPLGMVREFITGDDNTIDLKLHGITPFVDAARIYSLAHGGVQTGTVPRFRELVARGVFNAHEIDATIDAFLFIQLLRLKLHHEQARLGHALSNKTKPDQLNPLDRRILREAFRQARKLQSKLALDYQL